MIGYQIMQFANNLCEGKFISTRETGKHSYNTTNLPSVSVSTSTIGNR